MTEETSDNNPSHNEIMLVIDEILPDCSVQERADVYSHISKQIKGFQAINSVDTSGVEPLFDVRENTTARRDA